MTSPNRPRAFRLPAAEPAEGLEGIVPPPVPPNAVRIVEEPFEIVEAADGTAVPVAPKSRAPWLSVLMLALGGLVSLGIGLSLERMIADLFSAAPWLGGVALALLVLAAIAFLALVMRELAGIWRERRIEKLRAKAIEAIATRDHTGAQAVVAELCDLYATRTGLAAGRQRLRALGDTILDVDDRIGLAEHELLEPLDRQARNAIASAAKQVSAVTALSPRAIVDVAFVVFAAVRLLRQIATIYGGRPGFPRLPASRPRRLCASDRHGRDGGGREHDPAGARPRHRRAGLGEARRGRAQRPDDRPVRPRRPGRLPPAPLRQGRAAAPIGRGRGAAEADGRGREGVNQSPLRKPARRISPSGHGPCPLATLMWPDSPASTRAEPQE